MDDTNNVRAGVDAFGKLIHQFGPLDVYSRVLWEVVFEELFEINSDALEGKDASKSD